MNYDPSDGADVFFGPPEEFGEPSILDLAIENQGSPMPGQKCEAEKAIDSLRNRNSNSSGSEPESYRVYYADCYWYFHSWS